MPKTDKTELPLVALRGLVIFPSSLLSFDIKRMQSVEALEESLENDNLVFLTAQIDSTLEEPQETDLYKCGTVTKIVQILKLPGNMLRVICEGVERAVIEDFIQQKPFFKVHINQVEDSAADAIVSDDHLEALMRLAQESFEEYAEMNGRLMPDAIVDILSCSEPGRLADLLGAHSQMKMEDKQRLLEETDGVVRLEEATRLLRHEISILSMQRDILLKVKANVDQNQREYFLREQLKVIQEEIGEKDGVGAEIEAYRERMAKADLPDYVRDKMSKELLRLERMPNAMGEGSVIRDYIDWILDLPWSVKSVDRNNLARAERVLAKDHYGLEKVKERVLEYLAVRQFSARLDAPILCLVGPPGVGKTSIAKSVARALNRQYIRMSLGGVRDEADIRGHRKTYIGAMPGRILHGVKQAGTANPLILLDEIDKMSSDFRGNPGAALLEVLDGEQNNSFRDHYIELPFDLSDTLFICTANTLDTVPDALRDRLEIVTLSSYTQDEKLHIAKGFLIPKQLKKHGLRRNQLRIKEDAILDIILHYTREAGVRQLERYIGELCRKTVKLILMEKQRSATVSSQNITDFLGKRKHRHDKIQDESVSGICKGLAWTAYGGETLSIEVNTMKGSGKIQLTGNMGEVMKESAQAAISYIRSRSGKLEIGQSFYKDTDVHVHIPEGATPKDGPSAGITMATAIISALTEKAVRNDIGMTGEITIRGRVLPIGGLKEKVIAGRNAGLTKILLPFDNESDLDELPVYLKEGIEFVLVRDMDEVLSEVFVMA